MTVYSSPEAGNGRASFSSGIIPPCRARTYGRKVRVNRSARLAFIMRYGRTARRNTQQFNLPPQYHLYWIFRGGAGWYVWTLPPKVLSNQSMACLSVFASPAFQLLYRPPFIMLLVRYPSPSNNPAAYARAVLDLGILIVCRVPTPFLGLFNPTCQAFIAIDSHRLTRRALVRRLRDQTWYLERSSESSFLVHAFPPTS